MHLMMPRFHVHPTLGAADCVAVGFSVLAMTPLQRIDVAIGQLTAIVIQLSGLVVAAGILWLKVKEFRRATATERRVEENAQEIEKVKAAAATAVAAAREEAAHAHATARQVAREAAAERAAFEAKVAAAVAAAKAERDAEIAGLKDQIEYLKKDVRHGFKDVKNEIEIDRRVRALTPDPDGDRPLRVEVINPPSHPVPTAPQPPNENPSA